MVGPGDPPAGGSYEDGTLFLAGSGKIYQYDAASGTWVDTGVDLIPPAASALPPHDHDYLPLTGGTLTGSLTGTDAAFTGNVMVPTPTAADLGEAVNVDYLTTTIANLHLQRFLGEVSGNAISTASSWNTAQGQAIYQQTDRAQLPPGVSGKTIGLVMRQSQGHVTQFICDIARNLWFARTQVGGLWGQWSTLSPIVSTSAPVDPPGGAAVPHGTIWIQTDLTGMVE